MQTQGHSAARGVYQYDALNPTNSQSGWIISGRFQPCSSTHSSTSPPASGRPANASPFGRPIRPSPGAWRMKPSPPSPARPASAAASAPMPGVQPRYRHTVDGDKAAAKRCKTGADQARMLLRKRKKRCSHRLQRKGTMPMRFSRRSSSRRCDLRMLCSRHFGHETAIASNLLKILRPGEGGVPRRIPPHSELQDITIPSAFVLLWGTNMMHQPRQSRKQAG